MREHALRCGSSTGSEKVEIALAMSASCAANPPTQARVGPIWTPVILVRDERHTVLPAEEQAQRAFALVGVCAVRGLSLAPL
jgi:hypothetical protein